MKLGKMLLSLFAALAIMATVLVSGTAAMAEVTQNDGITLAENDPFNYHDPMDDHLLDPNSIYSTEDVDARIAARKAEEAKKKDSPVKADAAVTVAKVKTNDYDRSIVSFEEAHHNGNTTTSAKVDIGNVNATASADAGASVKDGVRVQASAGATVTAVKATGTAEYNNGTYSAKATGTVAAGVARAKGTVKAKLGPDGAELDANVSAEANLAEAKGTVSGSVGGAEIKATGTVTVGVGVKAGATLKDGKIKIEAGASVGVGGSVTVELDVSKVTGKATQEEREDVIDDNVRRTMEDIGKNTIEIPHNSGSTFGLGGIGDSIINTVKGWFSWAA